MHDRLGSPNGDKKAVESLSLCIFIDALGWEILKQHSFLDDVITLRAPLDTIFGYSSTCDPTILTGLLPRDHGHFSFFAYDPAASPFKKSLFLQLMRLVPKALSSRNRVRNIVGRVLRRRLRYTGYFNIYNMPFQLLPLFDYTEKRDLYQPGGINSGSPTIMDYARDTGIDFFLSDWRASEETNLEQLRAVINDPERSCRYAYLYMAAMDAILHRVGSVDAEVTQKMAWYEERIREILADAEQRYDEIRLFIFSDHGMTDIIGLCDLMTTMKSSGLEFGKDYTAVYDSTMARFWCLSEGAEERIVQTLTTVKEGHIMSEEEKHTLGVDFPDGRYGQIFFLLDPGILLVPSHMGERPLKGMHGYTPEDPASTASFLTNTLLDEVPQRLDGLYHLMHREIDRALPAARERT